LVFSSDPGTALRRGCFIQQDSNTSPRRLDELSSVGNLPMHVTAPPDGQCSVNDEGYLSLPGQQRDEKWIVTGVEVVTRLV
jgi:hypothetical protein